MRRIALPLCAASLLALPCATFAQTPAEALAAKWNTICATADNGTLLYVRCSETLGSTDPMANLVAARGQHLEEIPGQARVATRDQAPLPGVQRVDLGGGRTAWLRESADGSLGLNLEDELAANWSLFLSADLGRIERRRSRNEAAFDADSQSLTAGADWRPAAGWQLGGAYHDTREDLDYRETTSGLETRFSGPLLTASRELGQAWLVHAYAGWLQGDYRMRRSIRYQIAQASGVASVDAMASANPDAARRLYGIALNRAWSRGPWNGSFELGNDWNHTEIDGFRESGGGGVALELPERSIRSHIARFDSSLDRVGSQAWGVWQLSLGLGWRHEIDNARRQLSLGLAEDRLRNRISFSTEDPDSSWGEWSLGASFTFAHGHSAFLQYRQRFAHDFLDQRILALGWRVEL